jgi:choline kinase
MTDHVAIILAAGLGKRLGPMMGEHPKALLDVGGESLVGRLIRQLREAGVARSVVVIGHGADMVRAMLGARSDVVLVENPDYERGAILSLWHAREFLAGPALVLDADVFVPDAMVARLVQSPSECCFLLDGRVPPSGEEQMLMTRGDRVIDIAREPRGSFELSGESVGFLKLSADAARRLRDILDAHVERGDVDIEHEEAYPELLQAVHVSYERVDDFDWTEVDFPGDVERARELAASEDFPEE